MRTLCREIEYLKKETAQRRAQEQTEATQKEEADSLQEKVSETVPLGSGEELCSGSPCWLSLQNLPPAPPFPIWPEIPDPVLVIVSLQLYLKTCLLNLEGIFFS